MTVNFSLIKLIPAEESHREFTYQLRKATLRDVVDRVWGWDDNIARDHHSQDWINKRPKIILYSDKPIGTIYVGENADHIEIEQFYVLPEYQNKGIGTHVLKGILNKADLSRLTVKLAYMQINPAASLYKRHGFEIIRSDDIFHFTERKPGGKA